MSVRSFAAAALVIALAGPAVAQPPDRPRRDRTPQAETTSSRLLAPFRAVVAKANESTVRVLSDGKEVALGTVVFADGYVLTKASELRGEVTVRFADGASEAAKVVGAHQKTDLALLKVEKKGLVPLAFGDSKVAVIGNWLAAAGIGSDPAAVGIVSVATRTFGDKEKLEEKMTGRHLNAKRGYLGIQMGDRSPTDGGVQVDVVSKGGAAEKAGLKAKDVIYEVNGKAVTDPSALVDMLNDMRPGQKLTLGVRRKGEELQLPATLAGPPAGFSNRADIQNTMGGPLSDRRGGFETVLQTDMLVDPKNCGGPVVDLDGRVVGVCISRAGRVETYVLPGEIIRPLLADLRAGRFPPQAPATSAPAPARPAPVDDVQVDKPQRPTRPAP
ncbi:PDZ domain-containing protein [bacterium]|nr:PDZ domain-containing protein [bacterium]